MIKFYYASMVNKLRKLYNNLDFDTWPYITRIDEYKQLLMKETAKRITSRGR